MTDFIPPKDNPPCNLETCRFNAFGECINEEKRQECVEVSKKSFVFGGRK